MRFYTQALLVVLLVLSILYLFAAGIAWQFNNPIGNKLTFWRHLPSALQFKSLPQYQEPQQIKEP